MPPKATRKAASKPTKTHLVIPTDPAIGGKVEGSLNLLELASADWRSERFLGCGTSGRPFALNDKKKWQRFIPIEKCKAKVKAKRVANIRL